MVIDVEVDTQVPQPPDGASSFSNESFTATRYLRRPTKLSVMPGFGPLVQCGTLGYEYTICKIGRVERNGSNERN
jgi:hypothetical protein